MKVVVCGSRDVKDTAEVRRGLEEALHILDIKPTLIISGGARGADRVGEAWARDNGIPVQQFIPDWDGIGKSAGFKRNEEMAENADACVALWDGKSRGTAHMIKTAKKRGLPTRISFVRFAARDNRKYRKRTPRRLR